MADTRFHALPADMAPHLPDHLSWEEAGSIQPLAVSRLSLFWWLLIDRLVSRSGRGRV